MSFFCYVFVAFVITSCSKVNIQEVKNIEKEYEMNIANIPIKNGVLVFEDFTHFTKVKVVYTEKSKSTSIYARGSSVGSGFVSMYDCFEEITVDENRIVDSLDNLPTSATAADFDNSHTQLLNTYTKAFVVLQTDDGENYLELNVRENALGKLIDPDGFVQIGNDLYQFNYDSSKLLINGNTSQTNTLRTATQSNNNDIIVKSYTRTEITSGNPTHRESGYSWVKSCQNTSGRTRIITYQNFMVPISSEPGATQTIYQPYHEVTVRGLRRRVFGIWWDNAGGKEWSLLRFNLICSGNTTSGSFRFGQNTFSSPGFVSWSASSGTIVGWGNPHTLTRNISYDPNVQGQFQTPFIPIVFNSQLVSIGNFWNGNVRTCNIIK